jgi:hypothetical protein
MSRDGLEPSTLGLKVQTLQIPALTELRDFLEIPAHGAGRDLPGLRCARALDPACAFGVHHQPPAPHFDYHPHPITIW